MAVGIAVGGAGVAVGTGDVLMQATRSRIKPTPSPNLCDNLIVNLLNGFSVLITMGEERANEESAAPSLRRGLRDGESDRPQ
jgi:hypothetical protein